MSRTEKKGIWSKIYMEWLRLYANVVSLILSFSMQFESFQSEFGWTNYDNLKFIINKYMIMCNSVATRYMQ
jgi:hypothetical protein